MALIFTQSIKHANDDAAARYELSVLSLSLWLGNILIYVFAYYGIGEGDGKNLSI